MQVSAAVAVAADMGTLDRRQFLHRGADRHEQPTELGGQLVGQVAEIVVGPRLQHEHDRQTTVQRREQPALVGPADAARGRVGGAPALVRLLPTSVRLDVQQRLQRLEP